MDKFINPIPLGVEKDTREILDFRPFKVGMNLIPQHRELMDPKGTSRYPRVKVWMVAIGVFLSTVNNMGGFRGVKERTQSNCIVLIYLSGK